MTVLNWYPSVVIPLPQYELFNYLLNELLIEVGDVIEEEVVRVAGDLVEGASRVWTEPSATSEALIATYATEAERQVPIDSQLLARARLKWRYTIE